MIKVFISYRREDTTQGWAALIHDRLEESMAADVFMDVDNLPFGVDWQEHIHAALRDCDVAFVLIGKLWFDATDEDGRRRLEDPNDVLRLEVAEVLSRKGVRVIPVLFAPATMPKASELPEDIRALAGKQALFWHKEDKPASQMQKIVEAVKLGRVRPAGGRGPSRLTDAVVVGHVGPALTARVLELCAELLDGLEDADALHEVERIQRRLRRPIQEGGVVLADAAHADAALQALDTLSWTKPELRCIRDRVEELRDSPDMQMIELAKWYARWSAGDVELAADKRAELERLLTAPSTPEQLGLKPGASRADVRHAADARVREWREYEAGGFASPMAQRVAGDVVRFYEELTA